MKKLLISACLIGENKRYDGGNNKLLRLEELKKHFILIPICPEVDGGLKTPRLPSEIVDDKIINIEGVDNTIPYHMGAKCALEIAKKEKITLALLKAKSPSCGVRNIYDGTFTHTLIDGEGITVSTLKKSIPDIKIFDETEIDELLNNK